MKRPSIFNYQDYRIFLNDFLSYLKDNNEEKVSLRSFTADAGFSSPGFLSSILTGKKNISENSVLKLSNALELSTMEMDFFRNLVLFNQNSEIETRLSLASRIVNQRVKNCAAILDDSKFELYKNWYCIPILVLIGRGGWVNENYDEVAKRFSPKLKKSDVKYALKLLEKLELIKRDLEGNYYQSNKVLNTENEIASLGIIKFHKNVILKSIDSITKVHRDHREISCATISVSEKKFKQIKKMVQDFREELLQAAKDDFLDAEEEVIQVNFQLFPLTQGCWVRGKDEN